MKKLIHTLKRLKKYGVSAVKQSLEDEGASFEEIKKMKEISLKANLDLNVKIGGCEAKNDIFFCKNIKANSIVAPMVESEYALKKFIQIANNTNNKFIKLFINIETKTALINLNNIFKSKNFSSLSGIVIGRSDIAGSLNLQKKDVDSDLIFKKVLNSLKLIKKKKKITKMGGSITPLSNSFVKYLFKKKLLDRIETRNVEIKLNNKNIESLDSIVKEIFNFEKQWLEYKCQMDSNKKSFNRLMDYKLRINEINKRIKKI